MPARARLIQSVQDEDMVDMDEQIKIVGNGECCGFFSLKGKSLRASSSKECKIADCLQQKGQLIHHVAVRPRGTLSVLTIRYDHLKLPVIMRKCFHRSVHCALV